MLFQLESTGRVVENVLVFFVCFVFFIFNVSSLNSLNYK